MRNNSQRVEFVPGVRPLASRVAPIADEEFGRLDPTMRDPIHYRKSGLSLNHIVGCPLECAYCIRHAVGAYEMKDPKFLCSDEEGVRLLTTHKFFRPHTTPLQFLNKATDPFLPAVLPHTFRVMELLDEMGLTNHFLLITRYHVSELDCERLNALKNLKVTLLVTYSGIDDPRIEPVKNRIPAESLTTAFRNAKSYRTVLYWRPIVPGLNDSDEHVKRAVELSASAHATVFTGLYFKDQMREYFSQIGLPELYDETARRKILPQALENRVLSLWRQFGGGPGIFRKTSCGVAYAHGVADYNGHIGVREICDVCPSSQISICEGAHRTPTAMEVSSLCAQIDAKAEVSAITPRAVTIDLEEQSRYFLQHQLRYQVHHSKLPHKPFRHGRADIGWDDNAESDQQATSSKLHHGS